MYLYLRNYHDSSPTAKKVANEIVTSIDLNQFTHKRTKKELVDCVSMLVDIVTSRYKLKDHQYFLAPFNKNLFSLDDRFNKYNFSTYKAAMRILEHNKVIYLAQKGFANLYIGEEGIEVKKGTTSTFGINELSKWDFNLTMLEKVRMLFKKKKGYDAIIRDKDDKKEIIGKIKDKDVRFINKSLRSMGYPEFQYHRIFQDDTNKCGRLYNVLQTVRKEEREKLYKEQDWVEVDFHAMGPNTVYKLETGDLYKGEMYNDILKELGVEEQYWIPYRKMIKQFFILVLNSNSRDHAKKAINYKLCTEYGVYDNLDEKFVDYLFGQKFLSRNNFDSNTKRYIFNPEQILKAFEVVHISIKDQFYKCSYQLTQNIESNIAINVMKYLISINEIPLSIHDCFVVPKNREKEIEEYMESVFISEIVKRKKEGERGFFYGNLEEGRKRIIRKLRIERKNIVRKFNKVKEVGKVKVAVKVKEFIKLPVENLREDNSKVNNKLDPLCVNYLRERIKNLSISINPISKKKVNHQVSHNLEVCRQE